MINSDVIATGLYDQLVSNPTLVNQHLEITMGEQLNTNPNHAPWLGLYVDTVDHDPHTLSTAHRRYQATVKLIIVVQATSLKNGADCSRRLGKLIKEALNAVVNETTFGKTIDMINEIKVSYSYNKTDNVSLHFQSAFIDISTEVENDDENGQC